MKHKLSQTQKFKRLFTGGLVHLMKEPLSITHPQLAAQWHPTKNGNLTPDQGIAGSTKKVWWKCPKGFDHEWEAQVRARVKGSRCLCCAGYKTSVTNSLASLYPEIAKEWHPEKKVHAPQSKR